MRRKRKRSIFFIKIIISYFALLFVVISVFMFALYRATAADYMNTAMKNQQELADKTAQQIDAFIFETDQIAQQVTRNPAVLNFFYKLQDDENRENYFKKDILNQIELASATLHYKRTKVA